MTRYIKNIDILFPIGPINILYCIVKKIQTFSIYRDISKYHHIFLDICCRFFTTLCDWKV